MTDKERADAMRAEAASLEAAANALNDELTALHGESTVYMQETKERKAMLRLTIDDKLKEGRDLAFKAEVLDPDPDAKHATIGG